MNRSFKIVIFLGGRGEGGVLMISLESHKFRYFFSLKFFDLPKTAPSNNFHQINRRNHLILAPGVDDGNREIVR